MHYRDPHEFPRRILLATTGLAPQILAETLYALAVQPLADGASDRGVAPDDGNARPSVSAKRRQPFVPTEIHVITTAEGRHRLVLTLLDPSSAILHKFADEFFLPDIASALTPERIHVIADTSGAPLADISEAAHNVAAADLTVGIMRELTGDPEAALHVSLAGGRKTMGFLLGYALTLFGRPQDRLSHVLFDAAFELHPQFFYPPRTPRVLTTRDDRPINTADARLLLADIPFVSLRQGLPKQLLEGAASFSETVAQANRGFTQPSLILDHVTRRISCQGRIIALRPKWFAVYAWLARRRKDGPGDGAVHWTEADGQELLAEYRQIGGLMPRAIRAQEGRLAEGVADDILEQDKARINSALREALGIFAAPYEIKQRGRIPGTSFERIGLDLDPAAISFGPIAEPDEEEAPWPLTSSHAMRGRSNGHGGAASTPSSGRISTLRPTLSPETWCWARCRCTWWRSSTHAGSASSTWPSTCPSTCAARSSRPTTSSGWGQSSWSIERSGLSSPLSLGRLHAARCGLDHHLVGVPISYAQGDGGAQRVARRARFHTHRVDLVDRPFAASARAEDHRRDHCQSWTAAGNLDREPAPRSGRHPLSGGDLCQAERKPQGHTAGAYVHHHLGYIAGAGGELKPEHMSEYFRIAGDVVGSIYRAGADVIHYFHGGPFPTAAVLGAQLSNGPRVVLYQWDPQAGTYREWGLLKHTLAMP
jgi:CRISPR-associated protein (TIGR02584 family)